MWLLNGLDLRHQRWECHVLNRHRPGPAVRASRSVAIPRVIVGRNLMPGLDRLINISDFEREARRRLPAPIFDVIAGGSGDEETLSRNGEALRALRLRPRVLTDVRKRDLSTTVFGEKISLPVILAPVGYQRMLHRHAEIASALAAEAAGTVFVCNTISTYPLETIAETTSGPKWFQLYLPEDKTAASDLVERVEAAGYSALCLTVDTQVPAKRERDIRNRMTVPLRPDPRMILAALRRPRWAIDFLLGGVGRNAAQVPMSIDAAGRAIASTTRPVTVEDFAWLRERWNGPLIVKGVMRGEDCERIIELGADGIVVSNHGGRQLDSAQSTIEALPAIVEALAGRAPVFIDGGFRRGTDVAKALALGARAVLVGRPFLFGLAVGGQSGVEKVIDIFRDELDSTIGLLGYASVRDLDSDAVAPTR